MKKILVLFFMLFISISFFSINIQNHPFNNLVSQLNINQIYQDHYDFLWLGTDYGIYRYDGQNIKSYFPSTKDTNSIKGKYINHIFEDSSKNLWFATNLGLNLFNYSKDTFEFFNIDKQILSLIEYNDDLFIGTSKGLVSFNKADNSFETISENLEEFSINDIEIHEEFVFLSTNQGLIKYLPRENNIEIYSKNHKIHR